VLGQGELYLVSVLGGQHILRNFLSPLRAGVGDKAAEGEKRRETRLPEVKGSRCLYTSIQVWELCEVVSNLHCCLILLLNCGCIAVSSQYSAFAKLTRYEPAIHIAGLFEQLASASCPSIPVQLTP
jgi:hypothetical protein